MKHRALSLYAASAVTLLACCAFALGEVTIQRRGDQDVIQIYMQDVNDAWDVFLNAWTYADQVLVVAEQHGIPVADYEETFDSLGGFSCYRDSIATEIQVHALGYAGYIERSLGTLLAMAGLGQLASDLEVLIPGDANWDGVVDNRDLAQVEASCPSSFWEEGYDVFSDFDLDYDVDEEDVQTVLDNMGRRAHCNPIDIELRPNERDWYWGALD